MQPSTGTQDTAQDAQVATQDSAMPRQMPPVPPADANPLPPAPALVSSPGEACSKCGAVVAADQRYCIECGERRGDPRLPFMDGSSLSEPPKPPQATAYPVNPYAAPPAPPKNKWSGGIAALATIATLLLAMGVGVLIGNNGDNSKATAQQPVYIGGTGASAATGATAAAGAAAGGAAAAADAASSDKGGSQNVDALAKKNGVKLAPKNVDLGGKCPKGTVGCNKSGKFTGDYFK